MKIKKVVLASKAWLWFYAIQTLVFLITFPFAVTLWKESVIYLIFLSQITALLGALGGLATVLAERKADPAFKEEDPEHQDEGLAGTEGAVVESRDDDTTGSV